MGSRSPQNRSPMNQTMKRKSSDSGAKGASGGAYYDFCVAWDDRVLWHPDGDADKAWRIQLSADGAADGLLSLVGADLPLRDKEQCFHEAYKLATMSSNAGGSSSSEDGGSSEGGSSSSSDGLARLDGKKPGSAKGSAVEPLLGFAVKAPPKAGKSSPRKKDSPKSSPRKNSPRPKSAEEGPPMKKQAVVDGGGGSSGMKKAAPGGGGAASSSAAVGGAAASSSAAANAEPNSPSKRLNPSNCRVQGVDAADYDFGQKFRPVEETLEQHGINGHFVFCKDKFSEAEWTKLTAVLADVHQPQQAKEVLKHLDKAAKSAKNVIVDRAELSIGERSKEAAFATLSMTKQLAESPAKRCLLLYRFPSHHSGFNKKNGFHGFCLFNNIIYCLLCFEKHWLSGWKKVPKPIGAAAGAGPKMVVVDIDVHHGNGTQDIVLMRPMQNTLFVSLHRKAATGVDEETDFFPFNHYNCPKEAIEDWSTVTHKELTELETEMRKQKLDLFPWQDSSICTHPNVLNIPLDQYYTDMEFAVSLQLLVKPAIEKFLEKEGNKEELAMMYISNGIDAHRMDEMDAGGLSTLGYKYAVSYLCELTSPNTKVVVASEGGYNHNANERCWREQAPSIVCAGDLPEEGPADKVRELADKGVHGSEAILKKIREQGEEALDARDKKDDFT